MQQACVHAFCEGMGSYSNLSKLLLCSVALQRRPKSVLCVCAAQSSSSFWLDGTPSYPLATLFSTMSLIASSMPLSSRQLHMHSFVRVPKICTLHLHFP